MIKSLRVFADDSSRSRPIPIEMSCLVRSSNCKTICLSEEFIFLLCGFRLTGLCCSIQKKSCILKFFLRCYRYPNAVTMPPIIVLKDVPFQLRKLSHYDPGFQLLYQNVQWLVQWYPLSGDQN